METWLRKLKSEMTARFATMVDELNECRFETVLFRCEHCNNVTCLDDIHLTEPGVVPSCICNIRKFVCGGTLVLMSEQEVEAYKKQKHQDSANAVVEARDNSTLPAWCLSAISSQCWEDGHACGQQEVDSLELSMISTFEIFMKS